MMQTADLLRRISIGDAEPSGEGFLKLLEEDESLSNALAASGLSLSEVLEICRKHESDSKIGQGKRDAFLKNLPALAYALRQYANVPQNAGLMQRATPLGADLLSLSLNEKCEDEFRTRLAANELPATMADLNETVFVDLREFEARAVEALAELAEPVESEKLKNVARSLRAA